MPGEAEIVLADDNDVGRYVIATMLRRAGFDVRETSDGPGALAEIATTRPDLVVLDVRMPGMDGFEVCRRIKADPETRNLPVLMLSATFLESESQVEGLETGADTYLTQPVEAPVLAATVRALLRARRAEAEVHAAAAQWRTTFDAIRDAVAIVDGSRVVVRVNLAFAGLLGGHPRDVVGTPIDDLPFATAIDAPERVDVALGDRVFAVQADPFPVGPEGEQHTVLTLFDVTAERRAEAQRAREIERERTISTTLQKSLLPERLPTHPLVDTRAWHKAAERDLLVGGDWYDVIETDHELWLVIGDVAGHGVASAAQASQLRHSLRVYAHEGFELADAVHRVNDLVLATGLTEFVTVCIAAIDTAAERLKVIRAGHPPPLFVPADGDPQLLEVQGPALGFRAGGHVEFEAPLRPGDRIVLYTDGLVERPGETVDVGLRRLVEAARGSHGLEGLRDHLLDTLLAPGELRDDVALLLAERCEA